MQAWATCVSDWVTSSVDWSHAVALSARPCAGTGARQVMLHPVHCRARTRALGPLLTRSNH
eukprot:15476901-Alexandrium_andersonii.AAC.1